MKNLKKSLKWLIVGSLIPLLTNYIFPISCRVDNAVTIYEISKDIQARGNSKKRDINFRTNIPNNKYNIVKCKECKATGIVRDTSATYFKSCEICLGSGFIHEEDTSSDKHTSEDVPIIDKDLIKKYLFDLMVF